MEVSSARWLSELGMAEDPDLLPCYQMSSFDEFSMQQIEAAAFVDDCFSDSYPSFDPSSNATTFSGDSPQINGCLESERPAKQLRSNSWGSCITEHISNNTTMGTTTPKSSSTPKILSFNNHQQQFYGDVSGSLKPKKEAVSPGHMIFSGSHVNRDSGNSKSDQGNSNNNNNNNNNNKRSAKPVSYTQDHILAERKRREKLSQRFIALSAIVPGLKKMDKASVLGDAIKYLKQLQERVRVLEEQTAKKTMESVVFIKKSQISTEDDISSTDENFTGQTDEPLPEIEARVSDKNVLIRIHCEKQTGILSKTLAEIEKLDLTVVNSNMMPFGDSALDITVIAEMGKEFSMTVKDLVKNLRAVFCHLV